MATTTRLAILEVLLGRLQGIRIEAGYETDAGARVAFNEIPELGEGDPVNAIALLVDDSESTQVGGYIDEAMSVECQALAKADPDDQTPVTLWPALAAELILGDIRRAIEQSDRTLGSRLKGEIQVGPTVILPREAGKTTVGVSQRYAMRYMRAWGTV